MYVFVKMEHRILQVFNKNDAGYCLTTFPASPLNNASDKLWDELINKKTNDCLFFAKKILYCTNL